MYDLSSLLGVRPAGELPPGTTLLVAGPSMTGKERFANAALSAGLDNGEGAVAITTNGPAGEVLSELEQQVPDLEHSHVGVLDCRADGDREERETPDGAFVHHVASPADLTGMGIGITRSFDRLERTDVDRGRLTLDSLSTMLTYTDRRTVFKFCHVLASRLDGAGYLGLFTVDSSAHDEQTLQVVKQAFDGLVEIRHVDGQREARLKGIEPEPTAWVSL